MAGFARVFGLCMALMGGITVAVGLYLLLTKGGFSQAAELRRALAWSTMGAGIGITALALIVGLLGEISDSLRRAEDQRR
jgi:uncharacterized membrane protein